MYLSKFIAVTVTKEVIVSIMAENVWNIMPHSTVAKTSLARRTVNNEFEPNLPTASRPERIMTRNNEVDFLHLGDHQNVAKI